MAVPGPDERPYDERPAARPAPLPEEPVGAEAKRPPAPASCCGCTPAGLLITFAVVMVGAGAVWLVETIFSALPGT